MPRFSFHYRIERVTPARTAELKTVRLKALKDSPSAFGSTYASERAFSDSDWRRRVEGWDGENAIGYMALDQHGPCGLIRCYRDEAARQRAHVASVWVAPEYRRAGVASALLNVVSDWAAERGAKELLLMVTNSNGGAIRFYERHGFLMTGRTEPHPNDKALFEREMVKRLIPQCKMDG